MSPQVIQLLNTCAPTRHFRERARQRHLSYDVEEFVVTWGTSIEGAHGATYLTIVQRDLPHDVRHCPLAQRANGWILVVAHDGSLITCYHGGVGAWKQLRRRREERNHRRAA